MARPSRPATKSIRLVASLVLLAVVGGLVARRLLTTGSHVVRGVSTVEFVTTTAPAPTTPARPVRRPKRQTVSWPMYGFDPARDRMAPDAYRERPPYRTLWRFPAHQYIEFPPVVAYDNVYVGQEQGRFWALDAATGRVRWTHSYPYCTAASPAVANGIVYQAFLPRPCDYGPRDVRAFVVAWDARTGKTLWRFWTTGGSESSILVVANRLYFGSWDHHLYALDLRGRRRPRLAWRYQTDGEIDGSPAYAGGNVYVGDNSGHLYALNAASGTLRWQASSFAGFVGPREYFYATPAIAYGRVFIGNTDGTVYAFGATTGHLLWAQHAGTYLYSSAAAWNKTIYVGSYDGHLYALDAATGDVRWRHSTPSTVHGSPTILNGLVYFSTCGQCGHRGSRYAKLGAEGTFALDARTGKRVWSFPDGKYTPLAADQERVYIAGEEHLYGLVPCQTRHARAKRRQHQQRSRAPC